jgi:hypothetical protein
MAKEKNVDSSVRKDTDSFEQKKNQYLHEPVSDIGDESGIFLQLSENEKERKITQRLLDDLKEEHIKFNVDLHWSVDDVIKFYSAIQNLYDYYSYYLTLQSRIDEKKIDYKFKLALALVYSKIFESKTIIIAFPEEIHTFHKTKDTIKRNLVLPLRVDKIKFASPGVHDFIGFGEVIGHIKETLFKVIEIFQTKDKRKLEEKRMEIENEMLSIEKNQKIIATYKELGFTNDQILQILGYENSNIKIISKLIEDKKITNVN